MKAIFPVAGYIFRQSFRNRMLNVLIIFAVIAIGFSFFISELAQETEMKMVKDFGLFAIEIFAFLTLMLSVTIQLFEETELKTLSLVIVKPVKRYEFLIGKYLGITATVGLNVLLMLAALMAIIWVKGGEPWDPYIVLPVFYSFLGIAVLSSTALLLTMITTSVPSCVLSLFFIYILGHLSIHLKSIAEDTGGRMFIIAANAVYYIFPNLEFFNLKDRVYSGDGGLSPEYFGITAAYGIFYTALTLLAASVIFNRKEF